MRKIQQTKIEGQKVLLRTDFNVTISLFCIVKIILNSIT